MVIQNGYYKFKGLYSADIPCRNTYREQETVHCVYVKLDSVVLLFEEDPDDGYRSWCNTSIVTEIPKEAVFNLEEYPVPCYVKNLDYEPKQRPEDDYPHGYFKGIVIYTDEDCKIELAKFGTDNVDDYYPSCCQWMDIPAINKHLAEHHLIGE